MPGNKINQNFLSCLQTEVGGTLLMWAEDTEGAKKANFLTS